MSEVDTMNKLQSLSNNVGLDLFNEKSRAVKNTWTLKNIQAWKDLVNDGQVKITALPIMKWQLRF